MVDRKTIPVEAAVSAAIVDLPQATRLPVQRRSAAAFTLAELVITVGVLGAPCFPFHAASEQRRNCYDSRSQANGRGFTGP